MKVTSDLLNETDRLGIGLNYIGQAFASAPADPDGTWPSKAVLDLFEDLQSDALEDGFAVELSNCQGVTSRGLEDGGTQEHELVAKYRSDADVFKDRWPRTAAALRSVAQ